MKKLFYIAACLTLSACLEPQPAPEVTYIPSTDFTIETLSEDMRKPWGVASLPEGGYLVTEFEGGLIYIEDGKTTDIAVNPLNFYVKGQGGFMGIVLAPDFQQSREVFFSYAYEDGDQNSTAIMRARFENGALENPKTIFKSSSKDTGSHFGGRMVFLPDETLVLTLGDGFAYREEAQNLENDLGKIVRLKRDGSPADGNPFADNENAKPDIYSYGHRNVQGLAYDSESGNLWAHEHGPRGGDELNLIKAGSNYGWPLATTGVDYNGARITPFKTYKDTEPFIYDWVPSIAPSGLAIYRGDMFPDWQGDALVGGLVARSVWRIDLDGAKVVGETRLFAELEQRIRDVKVDRDGAILVLTESSDGGSLYRVTPKK